VVDWDRITETRGWHRGLDGRLLRLDLRRRFRRPRMACTCCLIPGVLAATTAFGKTVIAAALIARRGCNTLVLVHRRELLTQRYDCDCFIGQGRRRKLRRSRRSGYPCRRPAPARPWHARGARS